MASTETYRSEGGRCAGRSLASRLRGHARRYTREGQVKERERRRALVGDWSPRDTEAKPGLLKRLVR